jgi:hypothetical protein
MLLTGSATTSRPHRKALAREAVHDASLLAKPLDRIERHSIHVSRMHVNHITRRKNVKQGDAS